MAPPSALEAALRQEADKQVWVNWLFSHIAERYDLGNDLMSLGWHTRWKHRLVQMTDIGAHHRVLDIACGTGDVTFLVAPLCAEVIGTDINHEMLAVARRKQPPGLNATFLEADAGALPFPDASFDRITIGYAGRGFPDWPAVLRECYRVLRPGGVLVNLDFARPPNRAWDWTYRTWMTVTGAVLGTVLHGQPMTYIYIPRSMRAYRGQRWLRDQMAQVGFEADLTETFATLMAFNRGRKPG